MESRKRVIREKKIKRGIKCGIKLQVFIILWAIFLFAAVVGISIQLERYDGYRIQAAHIQSLIEAEENRQTQLRRDLNYHESDAFIERIARERLNLIRPDEILFFHEDE